MFSLTVFYCYLCTHAKRTAPKRGPLLFPIQLSEEEVQLCEESVSLRVVLIHFLACEVLDSTHDVLVEYIVNTELPALLAALDCIVCRHPYSSHAELTICSEDTEGALLCRICALVVELDSPSAFSVFVLAFSVGSSRIPSVSALQCNIVRELVAETEIPNVQVMVLVIAADSDILASEVMEADTIRELSIAVVVNLNALVACSKEIILIVSVNISRIETSTTDRESNLQVFAKDYLAACEEIGRAHV